jgi:hypothetical protein
MTGADGIHLIVTQVLGPALTVQQLGAFSLQITQQDGPTITIDQADGPGLSVTQEMGPTLTVAVPGTLPGLLPGLLPQAFTFVQPLPSADWVVQHFLHRYPGVVVIDSAGSVVEGDVVYVSPDELQLHFVGGFSGTCYLI